MKATAATTHFQGDLFTKSVASMRVESTPHMVLNRRSKPPTFSSKSSFFRFVGQNPLISPLTYL